MPSRGVNAIYNAYALAFIFLSQQTTSAAQEKNRFEQLLVLLLLNVNGTYTQNDGEAENNWGQGINYFRLIFFDYLN
jgi:hypothetical protein